MMIGLSSNKQICNKPISTQKYQLPEKAIKLIKKFEGLKLKAYQDIVGVWTVGYGCTDKKYAFEGNEITKEKANELLMVDLEETEQELQKNLRQYETDGLLFNNNQYGALVSLCYNIGTYNIFYNSDKSLTRIHHFIKDKQIDRVREEFPRWVYAGGKVVKGLVKRREEEKELYDAKNRF